MTRYTCTGCGATVTDLDTEAAAGDLTTHDHDCEHHNLRTRCTHPGRCYEPQDAA